MRKVTLAAIILISMVSASFASGIEGNAPAIRSFKSNFGNVQNVQWNREGDCFVANFLQNTELVKAYYSSDGELFGTSKNISIEELPTHLKRAFAKRYGSYLVKEAIEFTGAESTAYFMIAENAQENLVIQILNGNMSVYKRTSK